MNSSELYLSLLKKTLTDTLYLPREIYIKKDSTFSKIFNGLLTRINYTLCKRRYIEFNNDIKVGKYHSPDAVTLIGYKRLEAIQACYEMIIKNNIPGDILEAGVWKGGATIFMNALLKIHNDSSRLLYAADSFEGCPPPSLPEDMADNYGAFTFLEASLDLVKDNFTRFDLLDDNVRFLKGWFKDTLPIAPFEKLSMVRVDGDMYESTMDVLVNVYDKVSPGGFILVDDYGGIEAARKAVDDFRKKRGIEDEIIKVDWTGIYWRKST